MKTAAVGTGALSTAFRAAAAAAAIANERFENFKRAVRSRQAGEATGGYHYRGCDHAGKGSGHRDNRAQVGVSARQQRRFRKAERRLPVFADLEFFAPAVRARTASKIRTVYGAKSA